MTVRRVDCSLDEKLYDKARRLNISWSKALTLGVKMSLEREETNKAEKLKDRIAEMKGAIKHYEGELLTVEQREQEEQKKRKEEAEQQKQHEREAKERQKHMDKALCRIVEKDKELAKQWLAVKVTNGLIGKVSEFAKKYKDKGITGITTERLLEYHKIKRG